MTQESLLEEDIPPSLEDSLGGLNERYSFMDNSLARSEFLLYLRNLHSSYETQIATSKSFMQKLQYANAALNQKLHTEEMNEEERKKLEENLRLNNLLLHNSIQLQNELVNYEQYLIWLELEFENELEVISSNREKNTLENQAQVARTYPYPTPFRYTPFPRTPFG